MQIGLGCHGSKIYFEILHSCGRKSSYLSKKQSVVARSSVKIEFRAWPMRYELFLLKILLK